GVGAVQVVGQGDVDRVGPRGLEHPLEVVVISHVLDAVAGGELVALFAVRGDDGHVLGVFAGVREGGQHRDLRDVAGSDEGVPNPARLDHFRALANNLCRAPGPGTPGAHRL